MKFDPKIIYEDEFILVLDKPAGLVVDRSASTKQATLQDHLENQGLAKGVARNGIVHRLDKETSGLLVAAKTSRAFDDLQSQFKKREVNKKYLALVHGRVAPKVGEISLPISRSRLNRKKFGVFLGGKKSMTKYKVLEVRKWEVRGRWVTLLELCPTTGRTHQIRVHLKHLGHPVVADAKYGGRKTARRDRRRCPRQFLHASQLAFCHPETKKMVKFKSPLPADLKKALGGLKKCP